MTIRFPFDNSYERLPERFYVRLDPTPVAEPGLIVLNRALAVELGLDPDRLATPEGVAVLAGAAVPEGAAPLAQAYAGHQFGNFVPQLGDGRAILLGEIVDRDGRRRDVQLKGSGPTPFSRRGDGRGALGPMLREYVIGEAMAALGVPTTRALAVCATGEPVYRETILPGAVLTRVAASHIRVGTFQYFAARGDTEGLRLLLAHAVARHDPDLVGRPDLPLAFFDAVMERQARLVARWLGIGFIHGVMNTDNMAVSGETIDYGPCAFMDEHHPGTVFSSIDQMGRYAYANQPRIAQWNLARLAECLLPLVEGEDEAALAAVNARLKTFPTRFEAAYLGVMRAKLGLEGAEDDDLELVEALSAAMAKHLVDHTRAFRALGAAVTGDARPFRDLFVDPTAADGWLDTWRARAAGDRRDPATRRRAMDAVNPVYVPRNHLVEEALSAASTRGDLAPLHALMAVLADPFTPREGLERYAEGPADHERVRETFCGT